MFTTSWTRRAPTMPEIRGRRLQELEDYDREKGQPPYVGDPWEQRLRQQQG